MQKIRVVVVNLLQFKQDFLENYNQGFKLDLSLTRIQVIGPDAYTYLNGQVTNELSNIKGEGFAQSILDSRGKIICSFYLNCHLPDEFEVFIETSLVEKFLERIELYHISEDFEVLSERKDFFSYFGLPFLDQNLKEIIFYGQNICLSPDKITGVYETITLKQFQFITGHIHQKNFFNESRFFEYTYSLSKGCFPGAETVSKISSGRGAAYYPCLINTKLNDHLTVEGKVVAKVVDTFDDFSYVQLLRNYRIHERECSFDQGKFKVFLFPFIPEGNKEIAKNYYEYALSEFIEENNLETSIQYLKNAIKLNPSFEDAYEMLGVILGRVENFQEAIAYMEKLNQINPNSMMAKTNLSLFNMRLGNIEIAEEFKSQATLLEFERAGIEHEKKVQKENIQEELLRKKSMFEQVLEIDAEDEVANFGLGEIAFELNQLSDAISYFKKVLEVNNTHSMSYLRLSESYKKIGDKENALKTLSIGIETAAKKGDLSPANKMQDLQRDLK